MIRAISNDSCHARRPLDASSVSTLRMGDNAGQLPEPDSCGLFSVVDTDDVPVFDCSKRQIGWLAGSAQARLSWDDGSARFMHYCMNAAVRWNQSGIGCDDDHSLTDAPSLRRIPVIDARARICAVVILRGETRPIEAGVESPSFGRPTVSTLSWLLRAKRIVGRP